MRNRKRSRLVSLGSASILTRAVVDGTRQEAGSLVLFYPI